MKKSLFILIGLLCVGGLMACASSEDAAPAPVAKGADNPAVGEPVGAGSGPGVGEPAPAPGATEPGGNTMTPGSGGKPPPPGGRGTK